MSQAPAHFRHTSLTDAPERDQIRLIRVLNTKGDVPQLAISIFEFNEHIPDYKALSYTWGAPTPRYNVVINGGLFTISENLYNFLMVYREYRVLDYVWIDQLAIDQDNIEERNRQVPLMIRIYGQAKEVLVWLGNADEHTTTAVRYVEHLAEWVDASGSSQVRPGKDVGSNEQRLQDRTEPPENIPYRVGIDSMIRGIIHRGYWSRLWIVQEVMIAKSIRVVIGSNIIDWKAFTTAFNLLAARPDLVPDLKRYFSFFEMLKRSVASHAPFEKWGLMDVLVFFQYNDQCADPRDRVYGLSSLLDGKVHVDYNKSAQQVFYEAMVMMTEEESQHLGESKGSFYHLVLACTELGAGMVPELFKIRRNDEYFDFMASIIRQKSNFMCAAKEEDAARWMTGEFRDFLVSRRFVDDDDGASWARFHRGDKPVAESVRLRWEQLQDEQDD